MFEYHQAGLGGARDATNFIESSNLAASVITTIGEEHMAALGGSLESIADAKSGIIKHGRPVRWFLCVCLSYNHWIISNLIDRILCVLIKRVGGFRWAVSSSYRMHSSF